MARLYAILGAVLAILEGGGMNTRKGFIRDGFGLAAILAAQSAPAILVRSMVAARNGIAAAKRGWVNPYVTDGLVAMWDGEWNAGGGVHDPNATVWKDLSGNGNDLNVDSSVSRFTDNSFVVQANSIGSLGSNVLTKSDGITTLQCAIRDINYQYNTNAVYIFGGPWYMLCKRTNNISASISDYIGSTRVGGYKIGYDGSSDLREAKVITVVRNGMNKGDIYFGDEKIVTSSSTAGATYSPPSGIMISAASFGTEHFNIKMYSRALTDEEIAANSSIDKARFNIA